MDRYYDHDSQQWLYGGAATVKFIYDNGGVESYTKKVVSEVLGSETVLNLITNEVMGNLKQPTIRVVK